MVTTGSTGSSTSPMNTRGFALKSVLLGLLIAFAASNVIEFKAIDARSPMSRYMVLPPHNTDDIRLIAMGGRSLRERFGVAFALAEVASGARLIVPDAHRYRNRNFLEAMYGFGRVEDIEYLPYDEDRFLLDLDVSQFVVTDDEYRGPPVAFAVQSETPQSFILLERPGDESFFLDTSLVPAGLLENLREPAGLLEEPPE